VSIINVEPFGEFVFDEQSGYEGTIEFQGEVVDVHFCEEDEIEILRFIGKDLNNFIEQATRFAVQELLDYVNWWEEEHWKGEGEYIPMTGDDFVKKISLSEIDIEDMDGFEYVLWFYYCGGEPLVGVTGNIESGFEGASFD